ncbi:hypothetical protein L873DRAFT_1816988 [Choiromyces venosus 120613-1]|uniref:Uncharacterized protein n=1 Tax=Choiromyces venosus 120613-1 TaxID=1336337 RepID=A0A3N4J3X5_9PEZI|nr:hypothetical protein L873DRAFT_1816988 [Choiromyces venosus 120613-1]
MTCLFLLRFALIYDTVMMDGWMDGWMDGMGSWQGGRKEGRKEGRKGLDEKNVGWLVWQVNDIMAL